MFIFPSSAAYVADISPPERRGEYSGLFAMSFSLAFSIGPWAGTLALDRFGGKTLWSATFLLGLLAAAMLWQLRAPVSHAAAAEAEAALPSAG
jgi:MFS family permease